MKRLIIGMTSLLLTMGLPHQTTAQTKAPAPVYPVPTPAQIAWQELETYAFVHFGLNTFNDLEWGYGNTPAKTFAPERLDTEQWVTTLKRAGMKGVILTAKHHDGFCLWPTKTTDYSVKNSPWKDGKGDLVRELSESCRKHGLLFGLYLSPWDRNSRYYGQPEYQRIFHEQIHELTTQYGKLFEYWFDGANGGNGWYGGADSTRQIDPKSYYRYEEASKMLRKNNKDIMIFGGTVPTIRWIGNEKGWAGETNWAMYNEDKAKHYSEAQWGMEDAQQWLPGEVDVSIRPGWFYHPREDHQVRSVANLVKLYYQSVGRNANLLLNCPIDLHGRIPAEDSTRLIAWHDHLQRAFRDNKLRGVTATASNLRSKTTKDFAPSLACDGNTKTYWATADGVTSGSLTFRFTRPTSLNTLVLQEYIALGQRVKRFHIEVEREPGVYTPIVTSDSLTTIGYKRIIHFEPVEARSLRLTIDESRGPICMAEVAAYLTPEVLEAPSVRRDETDSVHIFSTTPGVLIEYQVTDAAGKALTNGWTRYTAPFPLAENHATIRARVSATTNSDHPESVTRLGYAPSLIQTPALNDDDRKALLDGDGYTTVTLEAGQSSIELFLEQPQPISKLIYTPSQQRDASGHIRSYSLYLDGKKVVSGHFDNIRNNPIAQEILLPAGAVGSRLRLVADALVDGAKQITLGGLSIE